MMQPQVVLQFIRMRTKICIVLKVFIHLLILIFLFSSSCHEKATRALYVG